MDPARILITGAAGFVGRHLLPLVRARFPAAAVTGTSAEPRPDLRVLDITDRRGVGALVREIRPDVCIHLAAVSAVNAARRDAALTWRVNLHGTLWLAEAILAEAPECRLLLVSSADVYGGSFRIGRPLDETAPPAPANIYAATKAAADLAIGALVAAEGLRAIRLRPFNHTGPGQTAQFAVPAFARQIARI
ncbi:MAG: GDP-mannose 4,6-dehydratase, partial [Acetobacteraceae bacterium]|nr:GDP-mannose 4,6-dehydratase [Acetobacteraceae bacterium]